MNLKKPVRLGKTIVIGPAPTVEMLERLADGGCKSVFNLSRKGELNQPLNPEAEGSAVEDLGMSYIHLPVTLSTVKDAQVEEFCQLMEDAERPVYVHCRIGQRAVPFSLIYHALKRELTPEKLFQKAEKMGISAEAPFIRSLIAKHVKRAAEAAA